MYYVFGGIVGFVIGLIIYGFAIKRSRAGLIFLGMMICLVALALFLLGGFNRG